MARSPVFLPTADVASRGTSALPAASSPPLLYRLTRFWTLAVLLAIIIGFGSAAPEFFSQANWIATGSYATEFVILALGETFVIITAGIDLSVGANLGFSAMASALAMQAILAGHGNPWLATVAGIVVALLVGSLIGLLNGLAITVLKLTPFIVTLATMGIASGGIELLNNGQAIVTIPPQITDLGTMNLVGWIPLSIIVTAVLCLLAWLSLAKTRFGLRTYAIGSNEASARRAGIPLTSHLIRVYVLAGVLSGVAGVLITGRFTEASPLAGANDELNAIAAAVIGGASLFGGRGTIGGSIIGAAVISVLVTGLILTNVQPFWQPVAVGIVLLLAVYIDQLRTRLVY